MDNLSGTLGQPWNYIYSIRHTSPKQERNESQTQYSFPPRKFNMQKMSSTDATIHAAQDLIHALKNPAPKIPLIPLVNLHKEALIYPSYKFEKETSPRVPVKGNTKRNSNR